MSLASPQRILVATDFSSTADFALDGAIEIAKPSHAAIDLLHVYPLPGVNIPFADAVMMTTPEMMTALQAKFTEALEQRAVRVRAAGLTCSTTSVEGAAAQEIVKRGTSTGADLIVVGTHGRTGLTHALLGSVAERVVQTAAGPVLVIPHRDARPKK